MLAHQPSLDELVQLGDHHLVGRSSGTRQEWEAELSADGRCQAGQLSGRRAELTQTRCNHGLYRRREWTQRARAQPFDDVQSVAFRFPIKGVDGCRVECAPEHMRGEVTCIRRVEWSQLQLREASFSSERLQQRTDTGLDRKSTRLNS